MGADVQGTAVAFAYLGDGSRAAQEIGGTTTVPYLWDRVSGIRRLLDDGTTSAIFVHGSLLAEVDNATEERAWGLLDGLGSVRARADAAGLVTDTASWDAWGQATDAPEGVFGWTGEQTDAATGLVYLRQRCDAAALRPPPGPASARSGGQGARRGPGS